VFRLGPLVWSFLAVAVLGPAVFDLVVAAPRWESLSPETQGRLFGQILGGTLSRALIWVSLVSLSSALLWRIAGRRRWAGRLGSAVMLALCTFGSVGQCALQSNLERELRAMRAAREQHDRATLEALREGRTPPSEGEYLAAQAGRLERAAKSSVRQRRTLAALASYSRQQSQVMLELDAADAALPEQELDCASATEAELEARIAGMKRLQVAAEQARSFEERAEAVLREAFAAEGESGEQTAEVLQGMQACCVPPGSRVEAFALNEAGVAATLRALEFLRDYPDRERGASSSRIARACATPEFDALVDAASEAAERLQAQIDEVVDAQQVSPEAGPSGGTDR
jgi:uncharacterized membrane protein YqjE